MKNLDSVRCGVRYAAVPLTLAALAGCSEGRTRRPNIIVMMTDDHTTQAMSCYGSLLVETPNLDRLAREGMLFENCYVSNAISGPSRACILTGKYSHVNGFTDNSRTFDGDQQTFPKLLHDAGYQTAMIGKWHLNSDPQGFDFWSILVGQGEYYSPLFIENGVETSSPTRPSDSSNGATSRGPSPCSTTTRHRTATGCPRSVIWASTTIGSSPSLSTCWTTIRGAAAPPAGRRWRSAATCGPSGTSS